MKLASLILMTFLMVQILSSCADNTALSKKGKKQSSSGKIEEEIIYISNNERNIDVFNIDELYFSEEGVGYLNRRDYNYGEFGGRIEFCTSIDYYCLVGGIAAAIPKKINGQKEWRVAEWECQAETALTNHDVTTILCTYKGKSTQFKYSPDQGIISYHFPSNSDIKYKLIGDKGLLAPKE